MVIRYASDGPSPEAGSWNKRLNAPGPGGPPLAERVKALAGRGVSRLRRRLLPMLIVGAIPFAAALAYLKILPPVYTTAASVFVDPNNGRPGRADAPADTAVLAAHARIATSRPILQKAIERDKLTEDSALFIKPTGVAALADVVLSMIRGKAGQPVEDRASAILRLMSENISAQRSGDANLIEITAMASDAGTAAKMANAVAQTFVDELIATADKASGSDRARLLVKADELKARLKDTEARLSLFRAQNGIDTGTRGGDQDLAGQLARARAASLDAKTKSDQIQKLIAAGKDIEAIADLVRSPSIERLRIQYNEAAAQEANFKTSLGPRHPAYLESAEQAREKRRLLLEGLRLAASAVRADWQAAREVELALEKKLGVDAGAVVAAGQPAPAQLRELEREVELARLAYDRQMRMLDAADGSMQSAIARVVARAAAPSAAVSTSGGRVWKLAGLASALLALLVLATGRSNGHRAPVKKPGRTAKPPAASAPVTRPDIPMVRRRPAVTETVVPPEEVPDEQTPNQQADTIAHEFADRGEEFALQVTLVTATTSSLDKTGTALRLALAAARLDVRVLMIDATEQEQGLTTRYAAGHATGIIALQGRDRLIVEAELEPGVRVSIAPHDAARAVPANDGSLPRLTSIAGHFDLVIMDGPILTGGLAERKLARTAQSIVVVTTASAAVDQARLAGQLDVPKDSIRLIRAATSHPAPTQPSMPSVAEPRPISVIRLKKCA